MNASERAAVVEELGESEPKLLGDYEILKAIGKGKFATVYRAVRRSDGATVALKRINVDMIDEKSREKCLKEIKLLQSLDHQNIIKYLDSFISDNDLVIVVEWAAAGDLKRQIKKHQEKETHFEERIIWKYFSQVCDAIAHMHEKRIMHRDLKPANIFLTLDGTVKVGDLGLSRELSENTLQAHSKVGTPLYMSPEVLSGIGYDFKSDIWSLGCLLYELAMLKSPFKSEGLNLYTLFQKISEGQYQPLPEMYSAELTSLVHTILATDPNSRPTLPYICEVAQKMKYKFIDDYKKMKGAETMINTSNQQKLLATNTSIISDNPKSSDLFGPTKFLTTILTGEQQPNSIDCRESARSKETAEEVQRIRNDCKIGPEHNSSKSKQDSNGKEIITIGSKSPNPNRNVVEKKSPDKCLQSAGGGIVAMDFVYSKLTILNFHETQPTLTPLQFAFSLPPALMGNQFERYLDVCKWLIRQAADLGAEVDRHLGGLTLSDAPLTNAKRLLLLAQVCGVDKKYLDDINPINISHGYGEHACILLSLLADIVLKLRGHNWKQFNYPTNSKEIDISEPIDESQDAEEIDQGENETYHETTQYVRNQINSNVNATVWREEVSRISSKLSNGYKKPDMNWQFHLGFMKSFYEEPSIVNLLSLPESTLGLLRKCISDETKKLKSAEIVLNSKLSTSADVSIYAQLQEEIRTCEKNHSALIQKILELSSNIGSADEKLEELQLHFENKVSGGDHIFPIKNAILKLKQETKRMILCAGLIEAEIRRQQAHNREMKVFEC